MMNSKILRNGFSFIEVMISLTVIGFLLVALLTLQSNVFRRVVINTFKIDRFYPLKNMMLTSFMNPLKRGETKLEKTDEMLNLKMVYEVQKIKDPSVVSRFEGLFQKKTTGTWLERDRERAQEIISYGFAVPEKKEDEKK